MDIREMTTEQIDQLNLTKTTTEDMSTEIKTPKTRKATRERKNLPQLVLGSDASEEEASAAFNAVVLRTPLAKQLYVVEPGVPKKVDGEFTRVKSSVKAFEKRHGVKFKIGKHPTSGEVIIERIAPTPVSTDPQNGE
jgi:hypothetical protein